jgi:Dolichyl-phosphate-mannose-protein mannosyltransferase
MIAGRAPGRGFSPAALISAWLEPKRQDQAVLVLLALFVAAWTCFQVIAHSAISVHDDIAEVFVWSQHPSAGYAKHPPLAGWIAAFWLTLFPVADWSFYLLAMVNSAVALFAVDRIARRYVGGGKRILVPLLLLLTPFYQFHAVNFSTNQTLLSTWPIATFCFLRAFATRQAGWSALAGATAGLAMLGKYYSIYLVAGIVVAALSHPRRFDYLRSPSPWISAFVGMVVLAPHIYWLATTGLSPLQYAMAVHESPSALGAWMAVVGYLIGGLGYVTVPIVVYLAAARPDRSVLALALWPADPDRRMLVVLLASLLLLPAISAPFIGVKLTSLWTMSAWFLLPIVLLAPDEVTPPPVAIGCVALGVAVLTLVILAWAPAVALANYMAGIENGRAFYRVVAEEMTRSWRATMGRPLTITTGDRSLAQAASLYSGDHPDFTPSFGSPAAPWVTRERRQREGWAAVCRMDDQPCLSAVEREAAGGPTPVRVEKTLTVSFFGWQSASRQFLFITVPPQHP